MNPIRVLLIACASLSAVAAAPVAASENLPGDGLVRVATKAFDELWRRPGADLGVYRKVTVNAASATFATNWRKDINDTRNLANRVRPDDEARMAAEISRSLHAAVASEFAAQGYEIVPAAGPGVLHVSPSAVDLWVNAPDLQQPGIRSFAGHEAGEATLRLDVRDGTSGALLASIRDRRKSDLVYPVERATTVSNLFYFEAMFARWSRDCVRELRAAGPAP